MSAEQQEAERLLAVARDHKRAARRHRDASQKALMRLNELVTEAAKRGIDVHLNRKAQPGGHSGHHSNPEAQAQVQAGAGSA
jgi:hypothetical protein